MSLSSARKVLASCLVVPPVLWAASSLIGPDTGNGSSVHDQLKDLNKIAAHKGAFVASNIMFLFGALIFLIATYGIVHVYRGQKVGVGQIAGGLIALAMAVFFMFYGFGITNYEMVNHAQFKNPGTLQLFAQLNHFGQNSGPGGIVFLIFLLGIVLGPILLGIAMIRRRNVPLWAGILVILTGPIGFVVNGKVGNAIFQLVLLVALAPLALLMWRMSDSEWDAPREVAGARQDRAVAADAVAPRPAPVA
jgi:hypothetical protein